MDSTSLGFLKTLLETPSPSGYEGDVQRFVRDYAKDFADEVHTDVHGNVIVVKNPDAPLRVMLAGHCDQIGLIVQHVDDDGFLYVQQIGGWDPQVLIGQRMTVWTDKGPVFGVVGRKPIHLLTEDERKQVPKMRDLWLDIGAANKEEALKTVRIGDAVTVELGFRESRNNLAVSPAMDDKAGCWVVIEALRRAAESKKLTCGLYAVSTVQEELGLRGARTSAFGIDPQVGVAVDVTHATDCPSIDKKEEGDVRLGRGPVIHRGPNMNHKVVERLIKAADANKIAYQLAATGRATGTDANAMQISRAGMATGLVSIPNRYMHSPIEMISLDDLDRAADLLARFAENLDAEAKFTP
ncbi:MAG: M42 family metallopeptidase [Planctomycetaceae bacterium]|nr:M42 family metallopeptidase [Planctomycetaceae bacterium]